jgi:hypothetical protein
MRAEKPLFSIDSSLASSRFMAFGQLCEGRPPERASLRQGFAAPSDARQLLEFSSLLRLVELDESLLLLARAIIHLELSRFLAALLLR